MSWLLIDLLYILNRYSHIVFTTLLVGGILFYELVVPVAIDDLKHEQKLSVFGRARWSFRAIVWSCAILLLITGIVSTIRMRQQYWGRSAQNYVSRDAEGAVAAVARRPAWWWTGHVIVGVLAMVLAVSLMTVRTPPRNLLFWMRLNLVIVLLAIFLATMARHMRLFNMETNHSPVTASE